MAKQSMQYVVSVVRYNEYDGRGAGFAPHGFTGSWIVKLGLDVIGLVYKTGDDLAGQDDEEEFYAKHRNRWVWEHRGADGCSLDELRGAKSYDSQMEAVWALLGQCEKDSTAEEAEARR